jgi:hypothetical protein
MRDFASRSICMLSRVLREPQAPIKEALQVIRAGSRLCRQACVLIRMAYSLNREPYRRSYPHDRGKPCLRRVFPIASSLLKRLMVF